MKNNLKGKRVLITRARGQAEKDIARLREAGAIPIHIPLIEIVPPSDGWRALDVAIGRLDLYQWIVFTSQNSVRVFFERLCGKAVPRDIKFACVGKATAEALKDCGCNVDVIAREERAEGLLKEVGPLVKHGDRILWPRARDACQFLRDGLLSRSVTVDDVEAYATEIPRDVDFKRLVDLIDRRELDAVYFASPSAVKNFIQIVGRERAREFARRAFFIPIGPVTEEFLKRLHS